MYAMVHDRIFWIYFIVTLFFIILGVESIVIDSDPCTVMISILWLLSNLALMIVVYHASIEWGPIGDAGLQVCVVDSNSGCFEADNRVWLFINILFILLLIISVLWAGELSNPDAGPLRTMSGILILLGGLILCSLIAGKQFWYNNYTLAFWVAVSYIVIWFALTIYTVTS